MTAISNVYNRHWRIWIPRTVAQHCNLILPFSDPALIKKGLLVTDKELMMESLIRIRFFSLTDLVRRVLTSYLLNTYK
jgi:hypothetical protein